MDGDAARIERIIEEAFSVAKDVEGHLTDKEGRFLAMLAASPTSKGEVLEIGSFKGKSTTLLAKAASLVGLSGVVAVDPLTAPAETDLNLDIGGKASSLDDFQENLRSAGVEQLVEFHQMFSQELAVSWDRPLRLLWIDGDHTYAGAKSDFDLFSPHLADGAIIALHDVLQVYAGPIRTFMEDILLSDKFWPAGLCGSIGWAQFHKDGSGTRRYIDNKMSLYIKLSRLIPYMVFRDPASRLGWLDRRKWRFFRALVPHSRPAVSHWRQQVGISD